MNFFIEFEAFSTVSNSANKTLFSSSTRFQGFGSVSNRRYCIDDDGNETDVATFRSAGALEVVLGFLRSRPNSRINVYNVPSAVPITRFT